MRVNRTSIAVVCMVAAAVCVGIGAGAEEISAELRTSVEAAAELVSPSLVRVHVVEVNYMGGRETKWEATGSGVIFTKEGHVITNHHVAGNAKQLLCTLWDKDEIDAELVATDPLTDISVLKLLPEKPREFRVAKFGDSSKLKVGDYVLAVGSPLALSQSVTLGIVSNTKLVMPSVFWPSRMEVDGEDVGSIVRWIGHDAAIAGGSSGGALVNLAGEVVGINELSFGLSGAIPGNLAREVAEKLLKEGKVRRAWLGLEVQPLLRTGKAAEGVLVSGVIPGTPAEAAGLKSGDVLVSLAGKPVSVHVPEELPLFNEMAASLPIGTASDVVVERDGRRETLEVVPRERESAKPKERELAEWGMTARNLSLLAAKELKRESREGVLITSVRSGGPCDEAKPKLLVRDIVVEVGGEAVKTLEELVEVTGKLTAGESGPRQVLVGFERRSEKLLTVVKIGKERLPDPDREVRKAWLPAATQVLTQEMADALDMTGTTGVRVTEVYPNSSAEKGDLQVGDIITQIDGEAIPAFRPEHVEVFPTMVRQRRVGSEAELVVIRGGESRRLKVTLEESRTLPREMKRYHNEEFEFSARELAFEDVVRMKLSETQEGVYVESVTEGGWAALAHLAVGDIMLAVDGKATLDLASLEERMKEVAESKPRATVLRVQRGIHGLFVEMRPKWDK